VQRNDEDVEEEATEEDLELGHREPTTVYLLYHQMINLIRMRIPQMIRLMIFRLFKRHLELEKLGQRD